MSTWWQGIIDAACGLHSFMIGNMLVKIELDSFRKCILSNHERTKATW